MGTYYHASTKEYSIGQSISIDDYEGESTYDHERRTDEGKRINDLLDAARPEGVPSRKKCIYLFKKLKNCLSYAKSMHIKLVYEVQCNDEDVYGPFPMVLCNTLSHHLRDEAKKNAIITEYWHPAQDWKYLELLTTSFIVICKKAIPLFYMDNDIVEDKDLSNRLYGQES